MRVADKICYGNLVTLPSRNNYLVLLNAGKRSTICQTESDIFLRPVILVHLSWVDDSHHCLSGQIEFCELVQAPGASHG